MVNEIEDSELADMTAELAEVVFNRYKITESYSVFVDLPSGERGAVTVILSNLHTPAKPSDKIRATESVVTDEELKTVLESLKRWFKR